MAKMRYLFHFLPIPERPWVNCLLGFGWICEAFLETTLYYYWAPKYLQEIINPISVIIFISTYFAVIIGCIHGGIGIARYIQLFKKWMGYEE